MNAPTADLAFYFEDLGGGGVQMVSLRLAEALAARGRRVELWVGEASGALAARVPAEIAVVEIPASSRFAAARAVARAGGATALGVALASRDRDARFAAVPALVRTLRARRPHALLAATPYRNLEALLAAAQAGVATRIHVGEHNDLRAAHALGEPPHRAILARLQPRLYARAAGVVAVSAALADDVARRAALPRERIRVIYNPAVPPELEALAAKPPSHPWFAAGAPPVVLGVGRLGGAKDWPTLLRAFARLRARRDARLVLLGGDRRPARAAKRRDALHALARELGIDADLDLREHSENPFAYMAGAAVLAVSSRNEGFCNVIAEALACGCPVVSTDCPSGPAEILEDGRHGRLVPVGDDAAFAAALEATLAEPPDRERLRARGRCFTTAIAADAYDAWIFGASGAASSTAPPSTR